MDEPRSYLIRRPAEAPRPACDDPVWSAAERLEIDVYPWYESGARQGTRAAMLYDDREECADFIVQAVRHKASLSSAAVEFGRANSWRKRYKQARERIELIIQWSGRKTLWL